MKFENEKIISQIIKNKIHERDMERIAHDIIDIIEKEAEGRENFYAQKHSCTKHNQEIDSLKYTNQQLERQIQTLFDKIQGYENKPMNVSTAERELLDRNAYLSTEVEKLRAQIDMIKEETAIVKPEPQYINSHAKTEKEIQLYNQIEMLKSKLEKESCPNTDLSEENLSLKNRIDELLISNSELASQISNLNLNYYPI